MSLIPGLTGVATILLDGAKVDAISENTLNNGVQIKGKTDGSAVAVGYVGEVLSSYANPGNFTASLTQVCSVNLTPGRWMLSGAISFASIGGYAQLVIGTTPASATGTTLGKNNFYVTSNATVQAGQGVIPPFLVNISIATTYYLNALNNSNSSGSFDAGSMAAVRIA